MAYCEHEGRLSFERVKVESSSTRGFKKWKWLHRNGKLALLIGFAVAILALFVWIAIAADRQCHRVANAPDSEIVGAASYRTMYGGGR